MKDYLSDILKPSYHKFIKYNPFRVDLRSPFDNIYYCCTQKTASQWFRNILRDPLVYKYTGLRPIPYVQIGLREAKFDRPFPERSICIHLYIDYQTYLKISKPLNYRSFFILRDPRDILVSWYFSMKYSHPTFLLVSKLREEIQGMDFEEGMKFCIDTLNNLGLFEAQRSWMSTPVEDENVKIFRYEDFASDNFGFLLELFKYLRIEMPCADFDRLCAKNTFSRITGGRELGEEEIRSHYRKGVPGDWANYFSPAIAGYFHQVTGDLLDALSYPGY